MKYKSLLGKEFKYTGFKYVHSSWNSDSGIGTGRGSYAYGTVEKHQICDKPGPLFGIECVYELYKTDQYFIYPVSELERTKQVTKEDLLSPQINNSYDIY